MIKNDKNPTNIFNILWSHYASTIQNWLQFFTVISCLLSFNSICINAINYSKCKTVLKRNGSGLLDKRRYNSIRAHLCEARSVSLQMSDENRTLHHLSTFIALWVGGAYSAVTDCCGNSFPVPIKSTSLPCSLVVLHCKPVIYQPAAFKHELWKLLSSFESLLKN